MSGRMKGHALIAEGAPHDDMGDRLPSYWGGVSGYGRGKCSCGVLGPAHDSANYRKRWHRDHKEQIRKESRP